MNNSERTIYAGQIFRHFKGKLYQIVTVAAHSETKEKLVIYQQLYGQYKVFARPYEMFVSEVDHEKYPDVLQRYRFELVNMEEPDEISVQEQSVDTVEFSYKEKSNEERERPKPLSKVSRSNENEGVNPLLLLFLDAETYEEKRSILMSIKGEITDRLIDDIAVSMDVTVDKGELDERFASLLTCVDTMAKFEVDRLR